MNKKAYLHHPVVAIVVGFIVGLILMWLVCKEMVPFGAGIC